MSCTEVTEDTFVHYYLHCPPDEPVPMPIDREYCLETLRELVQTNSVNPSLVVGAPGEREIAERVAARLDGFHMQVELHEPEPGRISVTGRLRGSGGGRSLMLNGHYDTVDVSEMAEPFSARVANGKLYGRGSFDMKGSVAACIAAAKALAESNDPLRGDVIVAAVADEEYASIGTADLVASMPVDGAIVTEPTALQVCLAHKGFQWIEVTTGGRAAHGSRPDLGVDANLRMGRVLTKLDRLSRELSARARHPLVGPPSLHAALLKGGAGLSTYAPSCELSIERRTIPGETTASVSAEIDALIAELRADDPDLSVSARTLFAREPFEVAPDAPIVRAVVEGATRALGARPALVGDTPWMDSALLAAAGVDTVVFGPAGAGAHAAVEWVDIESVYRTGDVLVEAARIYCA